MLDAAKGSLFVTFRDVVDRILELPGSRYSCVAVTGSGEILAEAGSSIIEPALVLRWGKEATAVLDGAATGDMEDFILTTGGHYHLVRPLGGTRSLLVYLCVERARVNLALARRELAAARPENALPRAPGRGTSAPAGSPSPGVSRIASAMPPASRSSVSRRPDAGGVQVPLPRRTGYAAPPAETVPPQRRSTVPPVLRQEWADDVATMNRLLSALRALSSQAEER